MTEHEDKIMAADTIAVARETNRLLGVLIETIAGAARMYTQERLGCSAENHKKYSLDADTIASKVEGQ